MAKSVYSVLLSDHVIEAVDVLAAQRHTSRSALIDRLLAQALQLSTAQQRREDVFEALQALFLQLDATRMQILPYHTGAGMLSLNSQMPMRYRPTARYSIRVWEHPGACSVTISFRAKSEALTQALAVFYDIWLELEHAAHPNEERLCELEEDGRYTRYFPGTDKCADRMAAQLISSYIHEYDRALRAAVSLPAAQAQKTAQQAYAAYLPLERRICRQAGNGCFPLEEGRSQ